MEPGLSFWLRYVETEGGVVEPRGDTAVALLPEHLQSRFDLAEDLTVTADAEAAREDGALLLTAGHPVLDAAAGDALHRGDVGYRRLAWPVSRPPTEQVLLERVRDQLPIDHGKVDLDGVAARAYLPMVALGTLVNYALSFDDRFSEQEQVLVDGTTAAELDADALRGSGPSDLGDHAIGRPPDPDLDVDRAVASAHRVVARRAEARQSTLAGGVRAGRAAELDRTRAYYDAALDSIARRRAKAAPDRQAAYDAQADATRAERARRLAEVEEKFRPSFTVQPFRLHVNLVPALRVPTVIRRGPRAYPLTLSWVLGARRLAPVPCPSCGAVSPLVATRHRLGCRTCDGGPS